MENTLKKFQERSKEVLLRHKSILDIITKLDETNSKINRAVVKTVTSCGCVKINAKKQEIPIDISLDDLSDLMKNHIDGHICPICQDKIQEEIGNHIFYLFALSNTLDIDLEKTIKDEYDKINTLGKYSLF